MMTDQNIVTGQETPDSIAFATLPDEIVVIRVSGRGSFHNSVEVRRLAEAMFSRPGMAQPRFVLDLSECITMDSTFMGVIASIGLQQLKATGEKMAVVNTNDQNLRLLKTLGLTHFLNVRQSSAGTARIPEQEFQCLIKEDVNRKERIIHMIEAHRELCDADPTNNLRFESVLKYLQDSLEKEK